MIYLSGAIKIRIIPKFSGIHFDDGPMAFFQFSAQPFKGISAFDVGWHAQSIKHLFLIEHRRGTTLGRGSARSAEPVVHRIMDDIVLRDIDAELIGNISAGN